uniref:Major facilitator superfamily (MFS) profile domain-containing protein n=1 Tax=Strigamia maritima TaxID=126957 RepID=T1J931_STRMM
MTGQKKRETKARPIRECMRFVSSLPGVLKHADHTLLESLPTVIWSVFIGTWSDKNGRKLLLALPSFGGGLGMILMIVIAYYMEDLNVNYILLATLPYAVCGNILSIMTGAISYIADITEPKERTVRFGLVQASFLCGLPIGVSGGGFIFQNCGYIAVFTVSISLYVVAILYVMLFVPEPSKCNQKTSSKSKCFELFDLRNVKEGVETLYKKREQNDRFHLVLLVVAAAISFLPLYAEYNTTYLYARWKFQWDEVTYSNYSSCIFVSCLIGLILVMPFMSLHLKMKDFTIGIWSAFSNLIIDLITAVATEGWMLFAATPLAVVSGLNSTVIRSIMSQIVSAEEQGRIIAVMTAAEAAMPTLGSIMFTQVYNATRPTFPGAVFLMSSILDIIPGICFGWIFIQKRNKQNNQQTEYEAAKTNF